MWSHNRAGPRNSCYYQSIFDGRCINLLHRFFSLKSSFGELQSGPRLQLSIFTPKLNLVEKTVGRCRHQHFYYLFIYFCGFNVDRVLLTWIRQTCREQSNEIRASVSAEFGKRRITKPKIGSKMNVNEFSWPWIFFNVSSDGSCWVKVPSGCVKFVPSHGRKQNSRKSFFYLYLLPDTHLCSGEIFFYKDQKQLQYITFWS